MKTIKDILHIDPASEPLVNQGQARIVDKSDDAELRELRGELKMFVCEGEFARGLDCILREYLSNLNNSSQRSAWVSGFYGSGKSHLLKMLAHLWVDTKFADGASARGLVPALPKEIVAHLTELDTAGRRHGGLFSAAGTLLAGSHDRVRETVLGIMLRSSDLPDQYPLARFCLWLEDEGALDQVKQHVEANGGNWDKALINLWVGTHIPKAILAWKKDYAANEAGVRNTIKEQFQKQVGDLTTPQFIDMAKRIFLRYAKKNNRNPDQLPCAVIILDEAQQYVGDSLDRSTIFTEVAEALTKQFDGRVLLVAAGQQALHSVELLKKLMDRFTVKVPLSDTDVETVTRQVTLRKKPTAVAAVKALIEAHGGEIARHLQGSRIGPRSNDDATILDDYPLLPVRRRFWEECFRQIDAEGTKSQLRSQLRIIHDAVAAIADQPLTSIIPGDVLYDALKGAMLGTGSLLREIHERIEALAQPGTPDAILEKRIASTVFLISKLPTSAGADLGVRATPEHIADLLVSDLAANNHALRQHVEQTLDRLAAGGLLMKVGSEYRMQTRAGAQWLALYNQKQQAIKANEPSIQEIRNALIYGAIDEQVRSIRYLHGQPKEPRELRVNRDPTPPTASDRAVIVWVRDGWSAAEKDILSAARTAGAQSSLVYLFISKSQADDLRAAIVNCEAASKTLESNGPQTEAEGQEAAAGMTSIKTEAQSKRDRLIKEIVGSSKVWLGGGTEQLQVSLLEKLNQAAASAVVRQFPQFAVADKAAWDVAMKRAKEGADKPLDPIGHSGPVETHAVCQELLARAATGATGADLRTQLQDAPFGWPKDAIDTSLIVLVGAGHLSAKFNHLPITAAGLDQNKISKTVFTRESKTIAMADRLRLRGTLQKLSIISRTADEDGPKAAEFLGKLAALGKGTGGEEPLPTPASVVWIEDLQHRTGIEQLCEMVAQKVQLDEAADRWPALAATVASRSTGWDELNKLFGHARLEPGAAAINAEIEAIRTGRLLLEANDLVPPIRGKVAAILRERITATQDDHEKTFAKELQTLAANSVWNCLPSDTQETILSEVGLRQPEPVDVSTDTAIGVALAGLALDARRNAALAVPTLAGQALRKAAAKGEPEVRTVGIEKTTLRTSNDVQQWAKRAETLLLEEVKKGPVFVS